MELRDYQVKAINDIYKEWKTRNNVALVMPCRSGKTHTFCQIIKDNAGGSIVIAHRAELVAQISETLAKREIFHKIIGSISTQRECAKNSLIEFGKNYINPNSHIIVASVDTLIKTNPDEPWLKSITLWVTDECHHILAHEYDDETGKTVKGNKWGAVINLFERAKGLGVTATPLRADGKGLGIHADGVFQALVVAIKNAELEQRGFIAPYKIYAPRSYIDLSEVGTGSNGDYLQGKLNVAVHNSRIVGDVVNHYKKLIPGKTAMVFCVDVSQAMEQSQKFIDAGVPAIAASAKTPQLERLNIKRNFDAGMIKVICNVDLYGEGVDVPSLDAVILARPSKSFALVVQQISRPLTYYPGKTAIIIDHVGNIETHYADWVKYIVRGEWTLDRAEKGSRSTVISLVRTCPLCFAVYDKLEGITCPYCGGRPVASGRSTIEQVDGDLSELDHDVLAQLQGRILENQKPYKIPFNATYPIKKRLEFLHTRKVETLQELREAICKWHNLNGLSIKKSQRLFYRTYGYDVLTVQTLDQTKMQVITELLKTEIERL